MCDEKSPENEEEEVMARQRKEKKELQAKIQQMKKAVNKDKKKKKEVLEEITTMEREMKERHEKEIACYRQTVSEVSEDLKEITLKEEEEKGEEVESLTPQQGAERKVSKAEKRRQRKAEANREREARIKEEIANNKNCARNVEADQIKHLLKQRHLKMYEIEPDGNCMYAAISHQIQGQETVAALRSKAGQFIREHYTDFAPFITDPKTGDMLDPGQFDEYCDLIVNTPAWGGQPELRALSQVLKRRIEVIQAEGSCVVFGDDYPSEEAILLAYYRHYYGLGEHYNSVTPFSSGANASASAS